MKSSYWTLHRSGLCTVMGETFDTPNQMWRAMRKLNWTTEKFANASDASFAKVTMTATGYRVRLFHTLAAANRFHKSQLKARVSLPASPRSKIKQPA